MRRTAARALPAVLLLLVAGCGAEPVHDTAGAGEIRGAPLFVPLQPAPAPAADVAEPDATEPASAAEEPAGDEPETGDDASGGDVPIGDDVAVGDPSAPLSEPPPPPPADVPGAEPSGEQSAEPDAEEAPAAEPVADPATEVPAVVHATVAGSGDAPVELKFPEPDEKGLIFVTFEQLAAFEYLPPGGPKKKPAAGAAAGPVATAPGAGDADDPTSVEPLADALRKGASTIPEPIRRLSGKKIEVEGYMIPLRFEDGKVKSFFLSRHLQGCCFGVVPRVNDVIEVEMVGDGDAYYDAYMPIIVTGPFEVREDAGDPAYLQTIYYMKAETSRFAEDW